MDRRALVVVSAVFFVVGAIVLAPLHVRAGGQTNIDQKIAEAKTAADHEAIAAYFDKQAKAAKAKAKAHVEMGDAYKKIGGAIIEKQHIDQHCGAITAGYEAIAKENADLAEAHRAMAKQAGH